MKAQFEPPRRQAQQSFVAFTRTAAAFPFHWHYHPEFELTWIKRGEGTRFVGDRIEPYRSGDLILLGSNLPHTWSSERISPRGARHEALVIQFPAELFRPGTATTEFFAIGDLLTRAARGLSFSRRAAISVARDLEAVVTQRGLCAWCRLALVLDRLARCEGTRALASSGYIPTLQHRAQRRFARIMAYIDDHSNEPALTLGEVARTVHLTPSALSRFFRRMAGRSFVAHVNHVRIGRACRLLVDTDRPVTDIAFASGFGNVANFNRQFRAATNLTPRAYRRRFEPGPA